LGIYISDKIYKGYSMNKIGLLWYDGSNLPLSTKIRGAITYYQEKYGTTPTLIMVHPKTAMDDDCNQFSIKTSKSVLKNHLWIGMEE
jgi:hypothetical protein